jgi:hypothetical protein
MKTFVAPTIHQGENGVFDAGRIGEAGKRRAKLTFMDVPEDGMGLRYDVRHGT